MFMVHVSARNSQKKLISALVLATGLAGCSSQYSRFDASEYENTPAPVQVGQQPMRPQYLPPQPAQTAQAATTSSIQPVNQVAGSGAPQASQYASAYQFKPPHLPPANVGGGLQPSNPAYQPAAQVQPVYQQNIPEPVTRYPSGLQQPVVNSGPNVQPSAPYEQQVYPAQANTYDHTPTTGQVPAPYYAKGYPKAKPRFRQYASASMTQGSGSAFVSATPKVLPQAKVNALGATASTGYATATAAQLQQSSHTTSLPQASAQYAQNVQPAPQNQQVAAVSQNQSVYNQPVTTQPVMQSTQSGQHQPVRQVPTSAGSSSSAQVAPQQQQVVAQQPAPAVQKQPQEQQVAAVTPTQPTTTDNTASGSTKFFRWPVRGRIISDFGQKPGGKRNDGINLAVPEGTDIKSVEDGTVVYAGNELKGFGNLILIRHAGGWVSAYAHNKTLGVKRGDKVNRGQVIAASGATGSVSQPQLHFELRKDNLPVDPLLHLPTS
ncbi:murein hydrolase activator EnvC family protein [Polycladidibacter stylochi]|uniref:murein hydrolase activator EnvC family protein n=1 Tax=Polycladidibacter stylochi TaxID=1807766 RepID=UPI00083126C1|nr:M23 family metallopeptidase [Pseudovibrio stylochi]